MEDKKLQSALLRLLPAGECLAMTNQTRRQFHVLQMEFYRRQAAFCHELATKAQAAKPLFSRLLALANSYEEKAKEIELQHRTPLVKNDLS